MNTYTFSLLQCVCISICSICVYQYIGREDLEFVLYVCVRMRVCKLNAYNCECDFEKNVLSLPLCVSESECISLLCTSKSVYL